jgi:hypothetical protein
METEFLLRLTITLLRIWLSTYGQDYGVQSDPFIFFLEGNRFVVTGEFKEVEKIVLCDDEYLHKCGFLNEQKIILKGETQILLEVTTYPWSFGDPVWYHTVPSHGKGYRFIIGQIYDQVTPIEKGGY